MADDGIAAAEIARQIAALKPRVEGSRGVMGYLDKPLGDKRVDVNKTFLASTIRGVNSHNRRQEEDKCWTLRQMERKLDESRDQRRPRRSRSHSRDRRRRRSPSRSRSGSPSSWKHRRRSRSRSMRREERSSSRHRRTRACSSATEVQREMKDREDERSYWSRKKAEKTRKLWENLHSEGTVSVENAPDFSSDESDHDDIKPKKPSPALDRNEKKHKKHKKHKKNDRKDDKKAKRRQKVSPTRTH